MSSRLVEWRQRWLSAPLLRWFRGNVPAMSETERAALEAGSVWWDAELFSGRPDWNRLIETPAARLTPAEQAFLGGPVERLCAMLDDWTMTDQLHDLPAEVWAFLKAEGFFGMIIPREHGGLGFSALAHSAVVMKISTRSVSAAVTVMVPNSLGPAELLLRYGTEAQREHYLPRLARGEELPCFALTGPLAGSDAASVPDRGVVCYREIDGERVLGMRVSWDKRYITLAPVATVMGLAFRLYDPDHLLGGEEDLGITVALVPTATPGVETGRRHRPAGQAFLNGPTRGSDVFMPLDWIIGGSERVGEGWPMLMECLSAGRAISLPSLSTGAAKFSARMSGAYARLREQFGIPIGRFEGVQEALARIAGEAYVLEAARQVTCAAIDRGEEPAVLSAILKYQATERMRSAVNDAMDIHGGKGICEGPSNYLANSYRALPVAITVEGANILTRSLIVFGQGAMRCHPFLRAELEAAAIDDEDEALEAFDAALWGHVGHTVRAALRAFGHGLTGGRFAAAPRGADDLAPHFRRLSQLSAVFVTVAEGCLLLLGGDLKRREALSGRLADVLSELYLLSCALKRFRDDGQPVTDRCLVDWVMARGVLNAERALDEVLANLPNRPVALVLRVLAFPLGRRTALGSDRLAARCAELLLHAGDGRTRLTDGIYIDPDPQGASGRVEDAFDGLEGLQQALRGVSRRGWAQLTPAAREQALERALSKGEISADDANTLRRVLQRVEQVIAVDEHGEVRA